MIVLLFKRWEKYEFREWKGKKYYKIVNVLCLKEKNCRIIIDYVSILFD